jgi:hypothetical protein
MGFFSRLFGTEAESPLQRAERSGTRPATVPTSEDQALERYRYMLRTAPPETVEQAHAEAFAKLSSPSRRPRPSARASPRRASTTHRHWRASPHAPRCANQARSSARSAPAAWASARACSRASPWASSAAWSPIAFSRRSVASAAERRAKQRQPTTLKPTTRLPPMTAKPTTEPTTATSAAAISRSDSRSNGVSRTRRPASAGARVFG